MFYEFLILYVAICHSVCNSVSNLAAVAAEVQMHLDLSDLGSSLRKGRIGKKRCGISFLHTGVA